MVGSREVVAVSKMFSYILRHGAIKENVPISKEGWVNVADMLAYAKSKGFELTLEDVKQVVESNDKKRFVLNGDCTKIIAAQGHSMDLELKLAKKIPPPVLFHGTADRFLTSILSQGLNKQSRHAVHLSATQEVAVSVGSRHGKPVVLQVDTREMVKNGVEFFQSENGVWLTDHIPAKYLTVLS